MAEIRRSARITGAQRDKLAADLKRKYERGASIRSLAESTGRSYGFVHRVLSETGAVMRGRGGASRIRRGRSDALVVEASIYLRDGGEEEGWAASEAVTTLLADLGFDDIEVLSPVISSFWQSLRAKAKDPEVRAAIEDRMTKLERVAEVQLLALPESQANQQNATGMATLIEAIKNERAAVIQVGSLLLVKVPTGEEDSTLICKTLTPKQMRHLEENPDLLRQPVNVVSELASIESSAGTPDDPIEKTG